jgi:hypothetical protein
MVVLTHCCRVFHTFCCRHPSHQNLPASGTQQYILLAHRPHSPGLVTAPCCCLHGALAQCCRVYSTYLHTSNTTATLPARQYTAVHTQDRNRTGSATVSHGLDNSRPAGRHDHQGAGTSSDCVPCRRLIPNTYALSYTSKLARQLWVHIIDVVLLDWTQLWGISGGAPGCNFSDTTTMLSA